MTAIGARLSLAAWRAAVEQARVRQEAHRYGEPVATFRTVWARASCSCLQGEEGFLRIDAADVLAD